LLGGLETGGQRKIGGTGASRDPGVARKVDDDATHILGVAPAVKRGPE
jgi:hypothetical protein